MADKVTTLRAIAPFYLSWTFGYLILCDMIISIWTLYSFADTIPSEQTLGYSLMLIFFIAILLLGFIGIKAKMYPLMMMYCVAMLCLIVTTYTGGETKIAKIFNGPMYIYRSLTVILGAHAAMYYRLIDELVFEDLALSATSYEKENFIEVKGVR
ncbi:hypothetical protein HDE_01574 [Halotydeus destructor]|nr:hypothetical protein HDE_01574 [Halotydeus destructor]